MYHLNLSTMLTSSKRARMLNALKGRKKKFSPLHFSESGKFYARFMFNHFLFVARVMPGNLLRYRERNAPDGLL
jgi:hypothetical protein